MSIENEQHENTSRPIILEIEEAKTRIIQEINAAIQKGIPCYLLKNALDSVFSQLRDGAKAELEAAQLQNKQTQ